MPEEAEELECRPCEENTPQEADGAQAPLWQRSALAPIVGSSFHPRLCHKEADGAPAPLWRRSAFAPSVGSFFHPSLCHKPCRFILDGVACARGAYCEFCHLDHGQCGSSPLDKKNRDTARRLGIRLASVLRPILAEKVQELGLGSGGVAAIEEWSIVAAAAWGQSEGALGDLKPSDARRAAGPGAGLLDGLKPSNVRRLVQQVQALPLNIVCSIIKCNSGSPVLSDRVEGLLASLRVAARVGQGHGDASVPVSVQ